jgi:hypothetical protein
MWHPFARKDRKINKNSPYYKKGFKLGQDYEKKRLEYLKVTNPKKYREILRTQKDVD